MLSTHSCKDCSEDDTHQATDAGGGGCDCMPNGGGAVLDSQGDVLPLKHLPVLRRIRHLCHPRCRKCLGICRCGNYVQVWGLATSFLPPPDGSEGVRVYYIYFIYLGAGTIYWCWKLHCHCILLHMIRPALAAFRRSRERKQNFIYAEQ